MKIDKISSHVNFTAVARVHGTTQELIDVGSKITDKVSRKSNGQPRFLWFMEFNNNKKQAGEYTFLITTEKDSDIIDKKYGENVTRQKGFDLSKITEFNPNGLIKVPDTILEAKDILEAIKNKSFDFLNLLIKKSA